MRTTAQVLLSLPATLCAPVAWMVLVCGYSAAHDGPVSVYFTKASLFFVGSLVGLIALWRSIFYTRALNVAVPSRLLVAGLAAGLLLNAFFLLGGFVSPPKNPDAPQVLFIVWLIGGPFVVGVWNLSAILSRRERA